MIPVIFAALALATGVQHSRLPTPSPSDLSKHPIAIASDGQCHISGAFFSQASVGTGSIIPFRRVPIRAARVLVVDRSTGEHWTATTDDLGVYHAIVPLQPGESTRALVEAVPDSGADDKELTCS